MYCKNIDQGKRLFKELLKEDYFFKDSLKDPWVIFKMNGIKNICLLDSEDYRYRIDKKHEELYGFDLLSASFKNSMIDKLKSHLFYDERVETRELYIRVAGNTDKIIYDLVNDKHEVVEITKEGWKITTTDEFLFRRYNHQKSQVYPIRGGDLKILGHYINIDSKDALLFTVNLIACFIPNIQHPLLDLRGEAGKGKSTILKILKAIVDPCESDLLILSDKDEDFFLNMDMHWLTIFDNVVKIDPQMSANFCTAITGIATSRRRRYTDKELSIIKIKRCVAINSLSNPITQNDLVTRAILIDAVGKRSDNKKPDEELFEELEADKPYILGKIFDIISKAIEIYPTVDFENKFRLAGFAKMGYAIAEAMGGRGKEFLKDYRNNQNLLEADFIANDTLVSAVKIFMEERTDDYWSGQPNVLFEEINRIAKGNGLYLKALPQSAPWVTRKLNENISLLKRAGIEYTHDGHKKDGSLITLRKI